MIEITTINLAMDILTSTKFKDFIKKYAERIKETKGKERDDEAKKSVDKTIEVLSEKQAEAITFEHIYLGLLDGRINEKEAAEIITSLEYKINPNPFRWLKDKLSDLRGWIIDSIRWLQTVGEALNLKIKEIIVEIGLTPKVSIIFIPGETGIYGAQ
jgi:hypothetical protein